MGGGSIIYANVSCEAKPGVFEQGWPKEITYSELKVHYDRVADYMSVSAVPDNQWTARMKLMKEAAEKLALQNRFAKLELAVSFDPAGHTRIGRRVSELRISSRISTERSRVRACILATAKLGVT